MRQLHGNGHRDLSIYVRVLRAVYDTSNYIYICENVKDIYPRTHYK